MKVKMKMAKKGPALPRTSEITPEIRILLVNVLREVEKGILDRNYRPSFELNLPDELRVRSLLRRLRYGAR
jgi:hypothetical protein